MAGIAHRLELDLEQSDDLKLAVTEACGLLLEQTESGEPIDVQFDWEDNKLDVTVGIRGTAGGPSEAPPTEDDNLGLFLMHALMDDVQSKNEGRTLVLRKDLSRRIDE